MIKYIEYDLVDETGVHLQSADDLYSINKIASGSYSPEIMRVLLNIKRRDDRTYIICNACGDFETWGCNRNGDALPQSDISHLSLLTDVGTDQEFGFKTFETAKFYFHHVNKPDSPSFGEVVYSYWNPIIHRIELIIAADTIKAKDVLEAINKGINVSVSFGLRVKYEFWCE